ncbi:MAG: DUF1501 domain-containing protein, partial [Fimbriimonadaceae bacterium]|nr:DUF1501 domain-containing protein [Fimbriimonadaceae bacterium]
MDDLLLNQAALQAITRRSLLKTAGYGIGSLALSALLRESGWAQDRKDPLAPKAPHFAPKAKSIIYLFMAGAPSQLDLFDAKPALTKYDRQECPEEYLRGERFAFIKGVPKLLASPYKFAQHGQSGQWISELLPHLPKIADDIAVIRTMQ